MTPTDLTLPGRLLHHARETPDRTALRVKRLGIWQPYTWADYRREVAACAHALHRMGVRPGDHVAILSDNRPEWLFADLGAQTLGARSVGIYQTNPADDVAYIVRHAAVRVLFCEDQEQVDKALAIADSALEHIVVFDPRGTRGYPDPRLTDYATLRQTGLDAHAADPAALDRWTATLDPDAPAMVVYTSGTTGEPKGALLTGRNALAIAPAVTRFLGVTPDDVLLSYLPLCHVAEKIFTLYTPLTAGCIVHFGESIATVRQDLCEVSPTVFLGVPRIWEKMHAGIILRMRDSSWLKRRLFDWAVRVGQRRVQRTLPRPRLETSGASEATDATHGIDATEATPADATRATLLDRLRDRLADFLVYRPLQERLGLRRCRIPITGAAPLSADLIAWYHAIGVPILEGYGQTECAGVSHTNPPSAPRIGTVGTVLPGLECRLAPDGEVLVRGPAVFPGYLHAPDATAATVIDDWLHTGDIGHIDADGYLTITGRKKEIIITAGGKNLSPEKIENALKTSPYIKEAVAIGDRRKFVAALIQIEPDAVGDYATRREITYTSFADLTQRPEVIALVDAELRAANAHLARVEQVRAFRLFDKELHQDDGELTATQKVRRRAIADKYGDLIEDMYRGKPSGGGHPS